MTYHSDGGRDGELQLRRLLPVLFWLAVATWAVAPLAAEQNRGVRFNRIVPEDGLPGAEVRQILQDRDGFIWLASGAGLARYDGRKFVSYEHDPEDPSSLSDNLVFSILETEDRVLWIGTHGGGLSRFDPVTRRFNNFRHNPNSPESLSDDRVRVVLEGPQGDLWLATDGGGISVLNRSSGRFRSYRHDPEDASSLSHDEIRDLAWDKEGQLWVATLGGGVSVLDPGTGRFERFRHDPIDPSSLSSDKVRRVYEDREGQIWVGTKDGGLSRFDRETKTFERVELLPPSKGNLLTDSVATIFQDSAGTLWVGTGAGLFERLAGRDRFSLHESSAADAQSIPHESVRALFEDRGGVLWVGTRGGLATWNIRSGSFLHHFRASDSPDELSDDWVNSFAEDPEGGVWVGTLGGLNHFDPVSDEFKQFLHSASDPTSLSDDRVMTLMVDRTGVLWVGTMEGGLNRFDSATESFVSYVHNPNDPTSVSANGITAICQDHLGVLWVGTFGGGLNRFDPERGTFESFMHDPDDPESLSSDRVLSIHEDTEGNLWIGSDKGGLSRLDPARRRFSTYRHNSADPQSLSSDAAWWVTSDRQGNLWVATRNAGINRWAAEDRRANRPNFRRYGQRDGLSNRVVYSILEARDGKLWLSTEQGLSRFDPETESFRDYDVTHGLQDEFNQAAAGRMRNGDLYFGGTRGFNVVSPEGIGTNPHRPAVVLTDFLKFNEPFFLGVPTARVNGINISHEDLVVAFEFVALDYTAPEKNRYQYMLEGFDQKWVDSQTEHRATYTNLDAGHYTFRVRGTNSDGIWGEGQLRVELFVSPPPWRSWWAHLIYIVVAGSTILFVMRVLRRRRRHALHLKEMNLSLHWEVEARKENELALKAERLKAREYWDVAEVVMVAIGRDGRVQLINQKGCRVLGYDESEVIGRDWAAEFVPVERREEVIATLGRTEDHPYCEYPLVTKTGEERVIAWHSTRLPSADGGWVTLSSGTDNTEIHALEKQVRTQQKMDALGTLAGGIAHDFNNILTAILGYSTLTLSLLEPDSEGAGYLRHVVQGCERASDMVARILTFSRREDSDKMPVDIGLIVQEACDLLRSSLPATIEIRTVIEPGLRPVLADPTQIHQVLMNLGTNSGHAMPDGGVLDVSVETVEVAPGSQSIDGEIRPGYYSSIKVRDSGGGMDKATQQRVFEPFFTTKEVGSGTGLGLSVAHGIVKGHRGDITVRSSPGEGTSVTVRLPSCAEASVQEESAQALVGGNERIMFVDDEKPIVLLAKKLLENQGYSVEPHTNGVEALAAFRASPRRFDLLIVDQNMPELEGSELVRQVRALRPQLPVVLTSGRDLRRESEELRCSWLQKPFRANELAACAREALTARGGLRSVG